MKRHQRWIGTGCIAVVLAAGMTVLPSAVARAEDPVEPVSTGTVRIDTPVAVPIVNGCHDRKLARLTFQMPEGGNYDIALGGWDADGYSFNGGASARGVSAGTHSVTLTSQICGYRRTPGRATLRIFMTVGNASEPVTGHGNFTAYTNLKNVTSVPLRSVTRVQRRGSWVRLEGVRALRGRFPDSKYAVPLTSARVRLYYRPVGGTWRYITSTRTDAKGVWRKRVQMKRTGDWQVRYVGKSRLMPDSSPVRRIRVR